MKLLRVVHAKNPAKKWRAEFSDGSSTEFGASAYQDYTQHGDEERRRLYRDRHAKDLMTEDPTKAGFLSMFILWGNSTDMGRNIASFKRRFDL
jgi:hypothetical protein